MQNKDWRWSKDEALLRDLVLTDLSSENQGALALAERLHASHRRFNETQLTHLYRCFLIGRDEFKVPDSDLLSALLLHDAIEDAGADTQSIIQAASQECLKLVEEATSESAAVDEPGFLEQVKNASPDGQLLKLIDRLDNCRSLLGLGAERREFVKKYTQVTIDVFMPLAYHRHQQLAEQLRSATDELLGEIDGIQRAP